MDGIPITGVEYVCRVCERAHPVYVRTERTDDGYEVDADRVWHRYCPDCEQERTHVLAVALHDDA